MRIRVFSTVVSVFNPSHFREVPVVGWLKRVDDQHRGSDFRNAGVDRSLCPEVFAELFGPVVVEQRGVLLRTGF